MVCDHCDQVFSSSEVMSPFLQGLDDSEEFSIIDVIFSFCRRESGRMIGTRMENSVRIFLHKYSSRGCEGGVCHDKERFGHVRHFDHWGGEECLFEFYECIVLFLPPLEGYSFLSQVMEWSSKCGEVGDELSVEITEPYEGSDCFD